MEKTISVNLRIWRQRGPRTKGQFQNYHLDGVSTGSSFLEMLDMLNQQLVEAGEEPVVFDNDCREGICGMCSLYINGHPHGPVQGITTCQLHMRKFNDGDTITIEPWRSAESRWKGRLCAYIGYNEELSHKVYAGADFLLMPSRFEPCGLSQMIAMRYGTLPIVRETGGLKDSVQPYNRFTGEGTGFSFANFNAHEMKDAF